MSLKTSSDGDRTTDQHNQASGVYVRQSAGYLSLWIRLLQSTCVMRNRTYKITTFNFLRVFPPN